MARRERYSLRVRCHGCGQVAVATFTENENPVYTKGDLNRVTESVGEGFELGGAGPEHILCKSCGSDQVFQDQ